MRQTAIKVAKGSCKSRLKGYLIFIQAESFNSTKGRKWLHIVVGQTVFIQNDFVEFCETI